jgi:hypothetical protein
MKLRFRKNSLRLRVNQSEVGALANGAPLKEEVHFPGGTSLTYVLQAVPEREPDAAFQSGTIRVTAPSSEVRAWASTDNVGLYFELSANGEPLKVAIEKDLVCIDGPPEERDPDAFPRAKASAC